MHRLIKYENVGENTVAYLPLSVDSNSSIIWSDPLPRATDSTLTPAYLASRAYSSSIWPTGYSLRSTCFAASAVTPATKSLSSAKFSLESSFIEPAILFFHSSSPLLLHSDSRVPLQM